MRLGGAGADTMDNSFGEFSMRRRDAPPPASSRHKPSKHIHQIRLYLGGDDRIGQEELFDRQVNSDIVNGLPAAMCQR